MQRHRKTPNSARDIHRQVTIEVDGQQRTGSVTIRDMGLGKVAFDVSYGAYCHHDTSLFGQHDLSIDVHIEAEFKKLVQAALLGR